MLDQKLFNANGVLINYAVSPTFGSPFLMLHGITERWQTFLPLLPNFPKKWKLYLPDLRGHGKSDPVRGSYRIVEYAQDMMCLLEEQVRQPTIILGHSIGALIAIYVAAKQPGRVVALILEEPPLHLQHTPLKDIPNGPYEAFRKIVQIVRASGSWEAVEVAMAQQFSGEGVEIRRERAKVLSQLDADALEMAITNEHIERFNTKALLSEIHCPTLLIQGNPNLGAALFDGDVEDAMLWLERGVRKQIPTGGHMLHQTNPEEILKEIDEFLMKQIKS